MCWRLSFGVLGFRSQNRQIWSAWSVWSVTGTLPVSSFVVGAIWLYSGLTYRSRCPMNSLTSYHVMSWRLCHFWIVSLHVPLALALRSSYGEVQSCAYTELYDAQVERTFWGNVQVKYCGTSITLTQSSAQPSAWTIVNWWDPKLQNTSLTDDDLKTFKDFSAALYSVSDC